MILDPAWIAVLLSGIAAALAASALLKSGRSDPAEMGTLSTRLALVRSILTHNLQRDEARARVAGGGDQSRHHAGPDYRRIGGSGSPAV
jgi:hypothetical protein